MKEKELLVLEEKLKARERIGFNGGVPITEEFYMENISGKHNDDIAVLLFPDDVQRGLKSTDDKDPIFRRLQRLRLSLMKQHRLAEEQLKAVNGLYKVRKWIEDRGLKRAAVTNAPKPNAELMISSIMLSDFFDAVILGSDCDHAKPYPDPYLKALEVLHVTKDHTFVFE
ncbi:hypothetical protein F2P56_012538, partial [Juglans regia]